MSARDDGGDDVILNREYALCEFSDTALDSLVERYTHARKVRSASYFESSIAGSVLLTVASSAHSYEGREPFSEIECLILASLYRDVHDVAASFGDGFTSDLAYVAEQDWRSTALIRSGRLRNVLPWISRSFWRVTSLYGTSAARFAAAVACVTLFFSILYAPTVGPLSALPHLSLRDDAFPNGYSSFWQGWAHAIYFSVVTLTTVGFGDIKPTNLLARAIVASEALLGVSLFGVLVTLATRRLPNRISRTWSPREGKRE